MLPATAGHVQSAQPYSKFDLRNHNKKSPMKTIHKKIMKNKQPIVLGALALTMALAIGCKKTESTADNGTVTDTNRSTIENVATNAWQKAKDATTNVVAGVKSGATNAWANVKEATTNTWASIQNSLQSTADYTYDQKDAFVAKAQADLDALDLKIKELSDKVASAGGDVKADAQAKMQDLTSQRSALNQKLTDLKNATADGWNSAKTGFKNALNSVETSFDQAWQWLKDKTGS